MNDENAQSLETGQIGSCKTTPVRGGGGAVALFFTLLLLSPVYSQRDIQPGDGGGQVEPGSISGVSTARDYGRIIDCKPKSHLTVCSPNDSRFAILYTNILGGDNDTYLVHPGQTLFLTDLQRSCWAIRGVTHNLSPVRFSLIGRTNFDITYRKNLPTALRDLYYPPGHTAPYSLNFPYLTILQQASIGRLALASGNWTVNIDIRTRLCHQATNASLNSDCSGVTGQGDCTNIIGALQVNRNSGNPGANCSSGACLWFDPPARYYGENYRRAWQNQTAVLTFEWNDEDSNGNFETPTASSVVEGVRVQLSPEPNNFFRLSATSEVYKGLLMMRKRTFLDGSRSLDPLGFPELGENELVFQETETGVQLQTMVSAWFVGSPSESFLLRIPNPDGSETVISDIVEWYADRLVWRSSPIPFTFSPRRYGYDHLLNDRSENIFIWSQATYTADRLPDYNPASSQNMLGSQVMELVFRPTPSSSLVIGQARFEVFFPATGNRHPPGGNAEPSTLQIPNWFYYYWKAMGSPAVVFTNRNPDPRRNLGGFYITGQPHVYVRDSTENYTTHSNCPLFAIRPGQCQAGMAASVVTSVDTMTVHGIHAFAWTVNHEFGHKWSYETTVQVAFGVYARIYNPPAAFDSGDGDGLADAWEQRNGLCPYAIHTTNANAYRLLRDYRIPSDPEVVADVLAYGSLLNADNTDTNRDGNAWNDPTLWIHDWSDKGLRYGNPFRRFGAFPWKYSSTGTNSSNNSDLLRGWSL